MSIVEYVSSFKYVRDLNVSEIVNMQGLQIFRVTQGLPIFVNMTEYGRVVNISGFRICQVSAYGRVTQSSGYA